VTKTGYSSGKTGCPKNAVTTTMTMTTMMTTMMMTTMMTTMTTTMIPKNAATMMTMITAR
jgi:hypothetical protein